MTSLKSGSRRRTRRTRSPRLVAAALAALLGVGVLEVPAANAAPPDMGSIRYWYPGSGQPLGRVMWPDWWSANGDLKEAATFSQGIGWSTVDQSRVPESGEDFYLRVQFDQHAPNALMSFNAAPQILLPAGLVRADDRLPVRCAAVLPPSSAFTEYPGGCGLAGSTNPASFTIISRSGVTPAPAFRMIRGTRWIWDIPVRATAPVPMTPAQVSIWANEAGVYGSTTTISSATFAGTPGAAIWTLYKAAPRRIINGVIMDELGGPDTAEIPIPWTNNTWLPPGPQQAAGVMQDYSPPGGPTTTITWAPLWGAHRVAAGFTALWHRYIADLGPARGDAHWVGGYSVYRQDFAGGTITDNDMGYPRVTIYCLSAHEMNC